jgi:colanic acid/amylovoran biosynthesis glycosyltransferase
VSRPTVVHCARDFIRPSETFVLDVVASVRRTRAVVVCGTRHSELPVVAGLTGVRVREIGRWVPRADRPAGRRAVRGLMLVTVLAERARVLHAHFGYWGAHVGRTARRSGRPWVLSLHGHDLLVEDRSNPEAAVLRWADRVVVPSSFLADAASRAGFPDDRIRVVPSGIDLSRFTAREHGQVDRVTVAFAGRFVTKKGVLDAVDALTLASRELPELRAVFVGYGPQETELRQRADAAGLALEVRPGDEPDAVRRALAEADLVVMPSCTAPDGDAESLGLVAVEAQASGVPVVATRHGGLVDAVHPDAGAFVAEHDVEGIAAAVVRLARAPEVRAQMGRAGRRHAQARFDLAERVAALEELYLSLAAPGTRPVTDMTEKR